MDKLDVFLAALTTTLLVAALIVVTSLVVLDNVTDDCRDFNKFNVASIIYTCVKVEDE